MKKRLLIPLSLVFALVMLVALVPQHLNRYQLDGTLRLSVLDESVTVHRDEVGIPYIFAQNMADAIRTQGFLVGQDRVFQVELYRAVIQGRLASLIGETGLDSDIKMRVVGLADNAKRHYEFLDQSSRNFLEWYAQGYNAFLADRQHEFPIELNLLGITPTPVTPADLLSVQHYAGFVQGRNFEDEILILNLANELGFEKLWEILPLNINPDRANSRAPLVDQAKLAALSSAVKPGLFANSNSSGLPFSVPSLGSNNWVGGNSKSVNGAPILANDPHLDASVLPGPWYPVGLFTNELKAIGANLPGVPGLMVGRNQHIAFGVTNAYGDSQDLFFENANPEAPDAYFDNGVSTPFDVKKSAISIKDDASKSGTREIELSVRKTARGPVISDHKVFKIQSDKPIVLRTAPAEITGSSIGLNELIVADSLAAADDALAKIDVLYMNYLFADKSGEIAHRATGAIPLRASGASPKLSDEDDWQGFIPKAEMPMTKNPERDWLGTSNHDVIPADYPYFYSTHFSPNYRYLRTKEWFSEPTPRSAEQHWELITDVKNKHAERLAPLFASALADRSDLEELLKALIDWNYHDSVDSTGATVFHSLHEQVIRLMFESHLSPDLLKTFLGSRYFWLQRTDELLLSENSQWFDLPSTDTQESMQDLIVLAAKKTKAKLQSELGDDPSNWQWGKYHKISFFSPLRQSGIGSKWLGGGTHPVSGSGETLNRGQYSLNGGPYRSQWFSSLRMVADLSDDSKIMGSISGGNAARQFHPYFSSQLDTWLEEAWRPWWLDQAKIQAHSQHELTLLPTLH